MSCRRSFIVLANVLGGFAAIGLHAAPCPTFLTASDAGYYYSAYSQAGRGPGIGFIAGASGTTEYRQFLAFDIPAALTNLLSTELWISRLYVSTRDAAETYELHEVTNSLLNLRNYEFPAQTVFDDLGDGALYGSKQVSSLDQNQTLVVPLNSAFVANLLSSAGKQLILGGSIPTLNADDSDSEYLAASSSDLTLFRLALRFADSGGPLQILDQPMGGNLLDGQEWRLRVIACGTDPISYQWRHNGTDIPDATNSVLRFESARSSDAGAYTVALTDPNGTITSNPVTISVDALRVQGGFSLTTPEGSDFTLSVYVESAHPVFYQWYHNGAALAGADSAALRIFNSTTGDAGTYFVAVTNVAGSATSGVYYVQIQSIPTYFNVPLQNLTAAEGATINLRADAYGAPPPAYYWFFNGAPLNVPLAAQLSLINVITNDAGIYRVVASNYLASVTNEARLTVSPAGPLDHWTLRNPFPQPNDLHDIAFVNGLFLAVGINGALLTSTNGQDWSLQQSRTVNELRAATYGAGQFVVVGNQVILTSADGIHWRNFYPGNYDLAAVTYGNGQFVAANRFGTQNFLVSSNAVDWRPISLGYYSYLNGVTFGDGLFAAAGLSDTLVAFTSTNGVDWATQRLGTFGQPEAVRYAGGRFLLVGSSGTVFTSNDGSQWIKRNPGTTLRLVDVDYGNGAYVAVGVRGTIARTSDLIHWSVFNAGTPDRLEGVVFAQNKFTAVGESGTTLIAPNGTSWMGQGRGTHLDLDGITTGPGGVVMAVGKNGTVVTTTNGIDLNIFDAGVTNDLHGVAFVPYSESAAGGSPGKIGRYVAVGDDGIIITSDDGFTWIRQTSPTNTALKAVTYGRGLFVVVGALRTILTSSNAVAWNAEPTPTFSLDLNDVAYGNGMFVVAGDGGYNRASLISADGHNWTMKSISVGRNMRGLSFAKGSFGLIGNDGYAFFSTGGDWLSRNTGILSDGDNLRGITYANGIWIIVGNNGIILTSPDTFNWTRRFSPVYVNLHGVRYLPNGTFLAIGNAGTILQSDRFAPLLEGARMPGGYQLTIHPGIGDSLRIQKSTTLSNWTDITAITNPTKPTIFLDTAATNRAAFYRAVSP